MRRALLLAALAPLAAGPAGAAPAGSASPANLAPLAVINPSVANVGDSLASFGQFAVNGGTSDYGNLAIPIGGAMSFQSHGYMSWVQALTGGRIRYGFGDNYGIYGQTSTQILARCAAAASHGGVPYGIAIVEMGENDPLSPIAAATTVVNMKACVASFLAYGTKVVMVPVLARAALKWSGGTTADNGYAQQAEEINEQYKAFAAVTPGVFFADSRAAYVDTSGYALAANTIADGLHNSPIGAKVVATPIAAIINQLLPPVDPFFASAQDIYSASHPSGNLLSGGLFTGTTSAVATGVQTGVVPAGWTVAAASTATGGMAVWSVTSDPVIGKCLTLTMMNVTGTGTPELFAYQTILTGTAIQPGDVLQPLVQVTTSGLTNIRSVGIHVNDSDGTTTYADFGMNTYNVTGFFQPTAYGPMPVVVPKITVRPYSGTGTASQQMRLAVTGDPTASGGMSGTVNFCRASLRKVIN